MLYTLPMRRLLNLFPLVFVAFWCLGANANSCGPLKRLKVKRVCGVVVDGVGAPIQGATAQLISEGGEAVSPKVSTGKEGYFYIEGAQTGDVFLFIAAPQHNSGQWPLKVRILFHLSSSFSALGLWLRRFPARPLFKALFVFRSQLIVTEQRRALIRCVL